MNNNEREGKKRKNKKNIIFFLILLLIVFLGICGGISLYNYFRSLPSEDGTANQITASSSDSDQAQAVENPIDFDSLQKKNDEIYAWITVEGTEVDYPIVQSASDDGFYLKHSAEDQSYSASGAIYTESVNSRNFNESITVIYGHNGYRKSMFTTLHYFEDEEFFTNHPYFYIYTSDSKLTYQIISAFKYDNRHIMNSFDFQNEDVLSGFQQMICSPVSTVKNVRSQLDVSINKNSKIVILSTCVSGQKSSRYLVCGVLIKNEQTY